jgi:hypothetical protein
MFRKLASFAALSLLVVGAQGVFAQDDITPVSYGDSFNGKISDPDDGVLYSFEGSEGDEVVIQASSNKIDVYLRLGNEDGDILAENDDISGDDLNAEIEYTLEDDGLYYFAVLGYEAGSYTVSLENTNGGGNNSASSDIIPVAYGDTITGETIDMDNPVIYAFDGVEGQQVTIVATSDEVDTYLIVIDAEANIVAENDDTSKKNSDASVEFTVPSTGVFLVGVLADESGPFELIIDSARIGSNNGGGTTNVSEEEPVGDLYYGTVDDDTPFNNIVLEDVPVGAVITVDIRTTDGDLDAYGGILFDDEVVAENDDRSRNDSNPILEYEVEEEGDYTIIITRAGFEDGNTSGDFDAVVNISGVSKTVVLDLVAFDTDGSRVIDKPIMRGFNPAGEGEKVESPLFAGVDSPAAPQQ